MSTIAKKLKDNAASIVVGSILILCFAVFGIYAIQHFGTKYAEKKINAQLAQSGLVDLIHYESVNFDPFTLTPSIDNVSVGIESAPWLRFARITFNSFSLNYPDLDIDFWIKQSSASDLSRDTGRLMRAAGIETLIGKGSFTSAIDGEAISSHFKLNVKDIGIISVSSEVNLLDHNIVMSEFRTDLLASLALGQPEAIFIIYGETLELRSLNINYTDTGLITPQLPQSADAKNTLRSMLKSRSESLGLTTKNSLEANQITDSIIGFLQEPNQINLSLLPPSPINLKALALLFGDKNLYKGSNMRISHQ
ncbi:hypothetical protein MUS1_04145 [Marinomonas ushuaiensis DSM 15871]|uniref:Uncharacterized protein n=1 Tax=Marinomonas ushuaiensis DSM 15871 TaxID=1122207 RepID=X7E217_9GAMM|nr:hypothetical protein [Marinomonas ushuaiensis]ETX10119.1 hypothetical protein MUS1_04145 [Marinomonas ushuaiensis DSM 15871]